MGDLLMPTSSLPVEILSLAFSSFDVRELFILRQVCRRWKAVVFGHPHFWRDICLNSTSNGSLQLLTLRLGNRSDRLIHITVRFTGYQRHLTSRILPILRTNLHRVRRLDVSLDELHILELYDALMTPAPNLEEVLLALHAGDCLVVLPRQTPMPPGVFGGKCPKLHRFRLRDVLLPDKPIPALKSIDELSMVYSLHTCQTFPNYVFTYFPELQRLHISAGSLRFLNSELPTSTTEGLQRLQYLELDYDDADCLKFIQLIPTSHIPDLLIIFPLEDTVYAALDALRGPFHMTFYRKSSIEFHICVQSTSLNLIRRFAELPDDYLLPHANINALLENHEFAAQLQSLTIATSLWALVTPWLPPYTTLPHLVVRVDDAIRERRGLPEEILEYPMLELLTLTLECNSGCVHIEAAEVVRFVDMITPSRTVMLKLAGVVVDNRDPSFCQRFS
ncbi:hypothetical protein EXIGLDRAFT_313274 [Exidia glandulosa HHB12029]|uniref:F-box domain-containing protein n=1 Tax=Exidia glandulosa HHB12029 TaxID=1314781 RepID=A0A165LTD3_EXIGL|nr:hypothetical protein EXIGLDRAFT_313274 [Exidia glandulosa HHB12029]